MRSLSERDLLAVWEEGQARRPPERGSRLLAAAEPELSSAELDALPLGGRHARLMQLRLLTFGDELHGLAVCQECSGSVEIGARISALLSAAGDERAAGEAQEIEVAGVRVRFRAVRGADLAWVSERSDGIDVAASMLVRRCILEATSGGELVAVETLPAAVLDEVGLRLAEIDPLAEVGLGVVCPACGHAWNAPFDVAAWLWTEVEVGARRILLEVDALARAYGWSEEEVLRVPPGRRRRYLELARA